MTTRKTLSAIVFLVVCRLVAPPGVTGQTFEQVGPILRTHCASCHHPAGIGPFSLTTYQDAFNRRDAIAAAVAKRVMPPWKPIGGAGEFVGDRRLSETQIAQIVAWVERGGPEGEPLGQPPTVDEGGWAGGRPDLIVSMPLPYTLAASGPDVFRNFVVPVPLAARRHIRAWEFRPGSTRGVHHATVGIDRSRKARELDAADPAPGYEGVVPFSVANPEGYFLGWSPGQQQPQRAISGMSWAMESGADLLFSMHLRPTGTEEPVLASIGLYFDQNPPADAPVTLRLGRQDIDIPPGSADYVIANAYRLPVDVELHSIYPHAHHLARRVTAVALLPDGRERLLLQIDDWDFNWQDVYRYRQPIALPAGTTVRMEFSYDNSGARTGHLHEPRRRVTYGPNSSDEMGDLWLQVVVHDRKLRPVLLRDFESKLRPETIVGLEMIARLRPDDAAVHDELGLLYQEDGRFEAAERHFRESLRIKPASAASYGNLASTLIAQDRAAAARPLLERAIALDPSHAPSRYSLGLALHLSGKPLEAIAEYRAAVAVRADYPEALYLLGSALNETGSNAEAAAVLRKALRARADWAPPMVRLAIVLASDPATGAREHREAVALAERGRLLSMPGTTAQSLDAAAMAFARLGQFTRAVAVADGALAQAREEGNLALAAELEKRLELYRRRRPFLTPHP